MRRARGFSLIELLVVLAVLGLLASLAMPAAEVTLQREKERELKRALWEIRDAIDAYKRAADAGSIAAASDSGYPPTLASLVQSVPDAKSAGGRLFFLRRIPRDPFADSRLPADQTWRLRSYASESDNPQPGADVYDVSSSSDATALNGTWLREW